jgi:hypothetical protein
MLHGASDGAVGGGTAPQAARSCFRFSMWSLGFFSLTSSIQPHYGPGVDSASNRNEYQEHLLGGKGGKDGWCVGLTNLPPSCADCLEILGALTSYSPQGLSRHV